MIRTLRVLGVLGAALAGGAGCTGAIEGLEPGSSPTPPGVTGPGIGGNIPTPPAGENPGLKPPTGDTTAGMLDDRETQPGKALLRRLTLSEYQNTVRDLLGVNADPALIKDSSDQESGGSGFMRGGPVTTAQDARAFSNSAEAIATAAQGKLGQLLPCSPIPSGAAEQEACVGQFITKFGLRAFRRPVAKEEADNLIGLYKGLRTGEAGASFDRAVTLLVAAILQSPAFLYHWELGPNAPIKDGAFIRFNSYEIASRLSYFLWGTMPDDKLFTAAAEGKLASPEQIATEARRMLQDPKALDGITAFHFQWLQMDGVEDMPKNPEDFKDYDKDIALAMVNETREFVKNTFAGPSATGKVEALFTSNKTWIDGKLARFYGINMAGDGVKEVTLDPKQRSGIFTQGSYLVTKADADASHPVKRGNTILERVLCTELHPPPGEQIPPVADPSPDKTTRERYAEHSANGACAECHKFIDPLGFAFENFDAVGKWRTTENNKPVDASGTYTIVDSGTKITFNNAVEMLSALAKAPEVQDCMVKQWMRYTLRRHETPGEKPSVAALSQTFKNKGLDMRELIVAVTKTRSFTHRALSDGEVAQ